MLGQQFYHESIRNVIVAFGTMFNNIQIVRKNNSGAIVQTMKVPLAYGPKQKFLTRLDQDPSTTGATAITLPRLGFEIGSLTYDPIRKMNRVQKFKKVKSSSSDSNKLDTQYMPVPYNMDITLYAMAKNSDDALQIVEQILPYFQPDYTLTINDMAVLKKMFLLSLQMFLMRIVIKEILKLEELLSILCHLLQNSFYTAQLHLVKLLRLFKLISMQIYQRSLLQENKDILLHQIQTQPMLMMILDLMKHLLSLRTLKTLIQ